MKKLSLAAIMLTGLASLVHHDKEYKMEGPTRLSKPRQSKRAIATKGKRHRSQRIRANRRK